MSVPVPFRGGMIVKEATLALLLVAAPVAAQPGPEASPGTASEQQIEMRYQIGVMERVLEQAVQHGAQMTGRQMTSLTPNLWLFAGPVRARGFRLEDYGLFFDVEVPALRRSLAWSFQTLEQQGLGLANALQSLRAHVESLSDPPARSALEEALERIELQVAPAVRPDVREASAARAVGPTPATPVGPTPATPAEPGDAYTGQVKAALIDAMLDHSGPIRLDRDEWLTVAARDSQQRLGPADIYDTLTIVLRISGQDLADFRAGRLSRAETTNRVEVHEF